MNPALPFALIIGIDQFTANKLAEKLSGKDINVIGVGEYVAGLNEINNFELLTDLSEVNGKFNYVFDFIGDKELWVTDQFRGEKVTLVCVNNKIKASVLKNNLTDLDLNWRLVEAEGVYGPEMDEDNFLAQGIKLAVVNKNLVLPNLASKFRILAVDDLVEAILRASFLSGTEKEKFLILGQETNSEEVAKVLIDEAKMTKYKVLQEDIEIDEVDEERLKESVKKLRWEPRLDFKDGVKETLQYFFSRADEESRKKKNTKLTTRNLTSITTSFVNEEKDKPKTKKKFEVVVEETPVVQHQSEEEIENFYKQKKMTIEVEEVKEVEKTSFLPKDEEVTMDEEFDDNFEDEILVEKKIVQETPKEKTKDPKKNIFKKIKWKIYLLSLTTILLILPTYWTIATILMVSNIKSNLSLVENKKYNQMGTSLEINLKRIEGIDQQIDDWELNKFKIFRNYQTLLKVGEEVLKLENKLIPISQSADLISQSIFKGREINFTSELDKEEKYLTEFETELGLVLARLNGDYGWMPAKWRMSLQKEALYLKEAKETLNLGIKGLKILPELLGLDGKERKYLVLLQNEAELRATGGFIGSYAILSFKSGNLLNFEVKDVYEADGQLKGHVEPPIEIKTHLGEANWYLRDANWNPDFVKTSADIQWFLNEEVGQKVDGVIGINLAVVKSILEVTGEIKMIDFEKQITKDNLYEEAEYFSESKFFPGSTQKASFLGTLGSQLFEEVKNLKMKQQLKLISSLVDLLERNEIQLAFNNDEVSKTTTDFGWSGTMYQGKCLEENCFSDYLFIVDSNFGVNKTNYFLSRNIEQVVDISSSLVERTLKINYENMAKSNDFPGGDYKNYLRVYLPTGIDLSQINLIDGNSNSKKTYTNEEVRIKEINGKKEVGLLVIVPVLTKKTVEIKYSSQNSLMNKNNFSYVNYIQKQSGFGDTGMVTLISFPSDWQLLQVEPQASVVGGKLLFNQKLDKDIQMGVLLGK